MEDARQKTRPVVLPASAVSGRSADMRYARRLIYLIFALCVPAVCQADDPPDVVLDDQFAEQPDTSSDAIPVSQESTEDSKACTLEDALRMQGQRIAQGMEVVPPPPTSYDGLFAAVALLLAAALAFRKFAERLERQFNSPAAALIVADDEHTIRKKLITEQPTMVSFFNTLRDGLDTDQPVPEALVALNNIQARMSRDETCAAAEALREYFDSAPIEFARLRALFSEISRTADDATRLELLLGFAEQIRPPKMIAQVPALRPIWLMAFALEGLLKQISFKASNVTPSTLRTAAGALDLLEMLSVPNLKPELATAPPIRILAVDDGPVCHRAIGLALKKVFHEPDLASGSQAALALVSQHTYDVIFLDVEMPGMNGFELCEKIRVTALNRNTPVVFVTRHSDFNSRAQSSLSGGQELIAKPYLPFEIVVKALTLALRGRLQNSMTEPRPVTSNGAFVRAALGTAVVAPGKDAHAAFDTAVITACGFNEKKDWLASSSP